MKKRVLLIVSAVCALALVLVLGIVIGKNVGATKSPDSSNNQTSETNVSAAETDPANPFKGNVVVMVSMYEGYLMSSDNAAALARNIDPSLHRQNQKFVDMWNDGERYYESNLDCNFIYEHYDDDYGLELGWSGCKIYDFRDRDFGSSIDLSTVGMESAGTMECQFGEFEFFQ